MHSATEILRDELIRTLVFIDDSCLPCQIIGHDVVLEVFPFQLVSRIEDSLARGEVLPFVDQLPPVHESPDLVDGFGSFVLFF